MTTLKGDSVLTISLLTFKIVSFAHISCQDSSIGDLDFTLLFSKTLVTFPTIDESDEELSFEQQKTKKTRLTYNCAHLRSTKESLTI